MAVYACSNKYNRDHDTLYIFPLIKNHSTVRVVVELEILIILYRAPAHY